MENIKAYIGDEPYIFVSYSHSDSEVMPILKEIHSNGYRFWYDEGIISGRAWADEIVKRIKNCCQFVVFISKNSILSENVKDEVHIAVKYNINIQVIYIDEVELSGGLELQLDRRQAVSKHKFSTVAAFYNKLISGLSKLALTKADNAVNKAQSEFESQYITSNNTAGSDAKDSFVAIKRNINTSALIKRFTFKNSVFGLEVKNSAVNELCVLRDLQAESCPFVPRIYDYFEDEENIFIAEEFIHGELLDEKLSSFDRDDKKLLQDKCVDICIKICNILRYLHNLKSPIVHRDIKPRNLIMTDDGDVYLIDFDICLRYKELKPFGFTCLGTRGYAAPEQYSSENIPDNRSDIYAVGVIFAELLTGKSPFFVYDLVEKPLRFYSKDFSPVIEKIILKMTALNPSDRYASVEEVLRDLQNYKHAGRISEFNLLRKSNGVIKAEQKRQEKIERERKKNIPPIPTLPQMPSVPPRTSPPQFMPNVNVQPVAPVPRAPIPAQSSSTFVTTVLPIDPNDCTSVLG